MREWWRHLRGRPFYWVLDGAHPAASWWMLRRVVERPDAARTARAARLALAEWEPVAALRARLGAGAMGWEPRYDSALWALRLLAEWGVPGDDERIAEALDRALDESDGSAPEAPIHADAILLHIAGAFGFHEDERVQARQARLRAALAADALPDAALDRADWLTQAAVALADLPDAQRDAATLARLEDQLARLSPDSLARYASFGFPLFDQPDGLALTRAALQLGFRGAWLRPWVERIVAAQDEQGLWHGGRALPMPGPIGAEPPGPSRWISAQALYVLRAFYGE